MTENEKIDGWTYEETIKAAENLVEAEQNIFKWDALRHLMYFAKAYRNELKQYHIAKKPYLEQAERDECWECPTCDSFIGYEVDCRDEHYAGVRFDAGICDF